MTQKEMIQTVKNSKKVFVSTRSLIGYVRISKQQALRIVRHKSEHVRLQSEDDLCFMGAVVDSRI